MYFLFIQYILSTEQMHFVITEFRLSTKCFKNSEVLTELSEKASTIADHALPTRCSTMGLKRRLHCFLLIYCSYRNCKVIEIDNL